jgi:hypothetical protein
MLIGIHRPAARRRRRHVLAAVGLLPITEAFASSGGSPPMHRTNCVSGVRRQAAAGGAQPNTATSEYRETLSIVGSQARRMAVVDDMLVLARAAPAATRCGRSTSISTR